MWDKDQEVLDERLAAILHRRLSLLLRVAGLHGRDMCHRRPTARRPIMGQAPGTHWYHAHKHGSTAINVANGMTGAFIIEGKYDDDLNAAYARYMLKDNKPWNTRSQPVLVLNQLGDRTQSADRPWTSGRR